MKKLTVLFLLLTFILTGCKQPISNKTPSLDNKQTVENNLSANIETCSYTVNPSLPKYNIKITYNSNKKENATSLSLINKDNEIQHFDLKENHRYTKNPIYITDITFDGYADVLVPYQRSASAQYFMAFIWDAATNKLIYTPTFENLSNVALDEENKLILSSFSADKTTSYSISTFDENLNDFKVCKALYYYPEGENIIYKEEKLENGTMQITSELTVPYDGNYDYSMNPQIENYYNENSDWNLNSLKWKKYLIPASETSAN